MRLLVLSGDEIRLSKPPSETKKTRLGLVSELFGGAEMVLGTGFVSSGQESRGKLIVEQRARGDSVADAVLEFHRE